MRNYYYCENIDIDFNCKIVTSASAISPLWLYLFASSRQLNLINCLNSQFDIIIIIYAECEPIIIIAAAIANEIYCFAASIVCH